MTEEWRSVPGYDGYYEVSNKGRVRSLDRVVIRSDGRRRTCRGRMLSPVLTPNNRHTVTLCKSGSELTIFIHVLMLEAFIGPRPIDLEACHRNDDPIDNRIENLYWGTHIENMRDMVRNGRCYNANKTHCPRDHEYSAENTYIIPTTGSRQCRKCARINRQNYDERRAAA